MWIGSRVMSTPAKSRPILTISRRASSVRLRGTLVMSSATVPSGNPRPSMSSVCSARGEQHRHGVEHLEVTDAQVPADRADTVVVVVLEQVDREPLLVAVEALVVLHQLLVEHVQDRLAGDVGHVIRTRLRSAAER